MSSHWRVPSSSLPSDRPNASHWSVAFQSSSTCNILAVQATARRLLARVIGRIQSLVLTAAAVGGGAWLWWERETDRYGPLQCRPISDGYGDCESFVRELATYDRVRLTSRVPTPTSLEGVTVTTTLRSDESCYVKAIFHTDNRVSRGYVLTLSSFSV